MKKIILFFILLLIVFLIYYLFFKNNNIMPDNPKLFRYEYHSSGGMPSKKSDIYLVENKSIIYTYSDYKGVENNGIILLNEKEYFDFYNIVKESKFYDFKSKYENNGEQDFGEIDIVIIVDDIKKDIAIKGSKFPIELSKIIEYINSIIAKNKIKK